MSKLIQYRYRVLVVVALLLVVSAATFGFAAANDVPAGVAGEGVGVISGYEVTNVVYTLDSNDPTQFLRVTFTLDANASDVYAGIGGGGNIFWTSCTGATVNFSCELAGSSVSVADANALHVSSVQ